MCRASLSNHNQQTYCSSVSCPANAIPIARKQASIHTFKAWSSTRRGCIISLHSVHSLDWRRVSFTLSSQTFVIELALLLIEPQVTRSQLGAQLGSRTRIRLAWWLWKPLESRFFWVQHAPPRCSMPALVRHPPTVLYSWTKCSLMWNTSTISSLI